MILLLLLRPTTCWLLLLLLLLRADWWSVSQGADRLEARAEVVRLLGERGLMRGEEGRSGVLPLCSRYIRTPAVNSCSQSLLLILQ